MRWDPLFADLEAQADLLDAVERAGEVDERSRIEAGALRMFDRLRASRGLQARVHCLGGHDVAGRLCRVGPDWLLLDAGSGVEALVAADAVVRVSGLSRWAEAPGSESRVDARSGLRQCLRRVVRDRLPLRVELVDGSSVTGILERVGADHVELTGRGAGEWRGASGEDRTLVPLRAVAVVIRQL